MIERGSNFGDMLKVDILAKYDPNEKDCVAWIAGAEDSWIMAQVNGSLVVVLGLHSSGCWRGRAAHYED